MRSRTLRNHRKYTADRVRDEPKIEFRSLEAAYHTGSLDALDETVTPGCHSTEPIQIFPSGFSKIQLMIVDSHSSDVMTSESTDSPSTTSHDWLQQWILSFLSSEHLSAFHSAQEVIVGWAKKRCIHSTPTAGFLDDSILSVMLCVAFLLLKKNLRVVTCHSLIVEFFKTFTTWNYNECSLAADSCGLAFDGLHTRGHAIDDLEGIDSDCEGAVSPKRAPRNLDSEMKEPDQHKDLAITGDDNDEVHPHKRLRFELGQMRDVRRFYDVENDFVKRIAVDEETKNFPTVLDHLDAFSVIHPVSGENLAIRILENHKKIILQELSRAYNLLVDSVGDDCDILFGESSELMKPVAFRESTFYIVFHISSSVTEILQEMSDILQEESWFLVQEIQAFHGVMVTPHPAPVYGNDASVVVLGIDFISDEPYSARRGTEIDFSGPMSRTLLRARSRVHSLPDFSLRLSDKFQIKAVLTSDIPFRC